MGVVWFVLAALVLLALGSAVVAALMRPRTVGPAYHERLGWRLGAEGVWLAPLAVGVIGLAILLGLMRGNGLLLLFNVGLPATILVAAPAALLVARGTFDFSIAGTVLLSGVVTALLSHSMGDLAPLAGIGAGLAIGLLNGALVSFTGTPAILLTLGMGLAAQALGRYLSDGSSVYSRLSPGWHSPVVGMALGGATVLWVLGLAALGMFTRVGRTESEASAGGLSAIQRVMTLGLPLALSGLAAGIVATIVVLRIDQAGANLSLGVEVNVALAVLAGGTCFGGRHPMVIGSALAGLGVAMLSLCLQMMELSGTMLPLFLGIGVVAAALATQAYGLVVGRLYGRRGARLAPAFPVQMAARSVPGVTPRV